MRKPLILVAVSAILAAAPVLAQDAAPADTAPMAPAATAPAPAMAAPAGGEVWLPSLVTETPQAGFDLAILLARKAVTTAQVEKEVLHKLRPNYAHDPKSLIDVSGVAAAWFATIAAANDYWRE